MASEQGLNLKEEEWKQGPPRRLLSMNSDDDLN